MSRLSLRRCALYTVALLFLCLGHPDSSRADQITSAESSKDAGLIQPWDAMDLRFRELYAAARADKIGALDAIVMVKEGKIILRCKDRTETVDLVNPRYHLFKSVDHVPLAIFVMLDGKTDMPLSDKDIDELVAFRDLYVKAAGNLDEWKLASPVVAQQKRIITESTSFLDQVVKNRRVKPEELRRFCKTIGPSLLDNARYAIEIELSNLDRCVRRWRKELGDDRWGKLRVVIVEGHMPRDQERVMLYFLKHLAEKREGYKIVYAENADKDEYALNLLGTHELDRDVADNFFGDPWRMHRDFLSDAAKEYLRTHKIESIGNAGKHP